VNSLKKLSDPFRLNGGDLALGVTKQEFFLLPDTLEVGFLALFTDEIS
jgi:hypothetical protein